MDIDLLIDRCEKENAALYKEAEKIALFNQEKVLKAFQNAKVALRHFAPTSGYGYDDEGRDCLRKVYAEAFGAESALVSPLFASGTHTIATALFGLLRPGDRIIFVNGTPYDTLLPVLFGENIGSLKDQGVTAEVLPLTESHELDFELLGRALKLPHRLVYLQRSRGYDFRDALSVTEIGEAVRFVRQFSDCPVMVDNCYGEFIEMTEPTQAGADIIAGSLIKNPGGGLAPTGGYIAGNAKLLAQIEGRMTAPGVGAEIGSYAGGYRNYFQGFFMAPHITLQAVKASLLFGAVFHELGYETLPAPGKRCGDIIRSIKFADENELTAFIRAIQKCSPVDSHVVPYAWDMPGYNDKVIMAAGTFVQGASIELSADSPMRAPYVAYLQGSLTYEHAVLALKQCLINLFP